MTSSRKFLKMFVILREGGGSRRIWYGNELSWLDSPPSRRI